ncbi:MAG: SHOCT domain-containing protein [Acidimicrobiia bacterium]
MMGQMPWWGAGWLLWLLFIVLLVVGLVILVRALAERTGTTEGRSSALGILEERFARGDIDAEEFEARRQALRS